MPGTHLAALVALLVACTYSPAEANQEIFRVPTYRVECVTYPNGYRALVVPWPLPSPWSYEIDFEGRGIFKCDAPPPNLTWDEVWDGGLPIVGLRNREEWP